jgi:hypothetical protein
MGPSRPRNSTRAANARSSLKPRRKPAKPSTLSDAERVAKGELPATALRDIRHRLEDARSVACVCAELLEKEAVESGPEVARCLRRFVSEALFRQTQHIGWLLGEPEDGVGGAS